MAITVSYTGRKTSSAKIRWFTPFDLGLRLALLKLVHGRVDRVLIEGDDARNDVVIALAHKIARPEVIGAPYPRSMDKGPKFEAVFAKDREYVGAVFAHHPAH